MQRWLALLLLAANGCTSTAAPDPRTADDVTARSASGRAQPAPAPKPRTFVERLAAVSKLLEGTLTPEAVAEIFEAQAQPTESPRSFRIDLPDDGGTIQVNVATDESPQRGVVFVRVSNLTLDDLIRLYGKRYEVMRGAKEGPLVVFDGTEAGWPYGLYISARVQGAARPRARIRSLELHYAQ